MPEKIWKKWVGLFLVLPLLSRPLSANVPARGEEALKFQHNLLLEKAKTREIGSYLRKLENLLAENHYQFLNNSKKMKDTEDQMALAKQELAKRQENLSANETRVKEILRGYLINLFDRSEGLEKLINKKTMVLDLQKELNNLKDEMVQNQGLRERLEKISMDLQKCRDLEEDLSGILLELEEKKKSVHEAYSATLARQNQLLKKKEPVKAARPATPGDLPPVGSPLQNFEVVHYQNKGMTFNFRGVQPLFNVGKGTVIYSGNLSTYGNVIMIDHGQGIRTVLLGKFRPKIKKNDVIEQGEVLGYTLGKQNEDSSLYFEVRRSNVIQDSIQWMDRKLLSKK